MPTPAAHIRLDCHMFAEQSGGPAIWCAALPSNRQRRHVSFRDMPTRPLVPRHSPETQFAWKPWQHGRIERLFLTPKQKLNLLVRSKGLALDALLTEFRYFYNHVRPHQHLPGWTPYEAWRCSKFRQRGSHAFVRNARFPGERTANTIGRVRHRSKIRYLRTDHADPNIERGSDGKRITCCRGWLIGK